MSGQPAGRTAVRTPCRYEVLRYDKNRDFARMENVYGKYTKMRAKFVPYLVRNSLHIRSVFLSEILVLNLHYFEDRPQNRCWTVQYFEDRPQNTF